MDATNYHLVLLAKNLTGYKNLLKLTTEAHLNGFYYKPRVDWELLKNHHEGLIALTACLKGEIPQIISHIRFVRNDVHKESHSPRFTIVAQLPDIATETPPARIQRAIPGPQLKLEVRYPDAFVRKLGERTLRHDRQSVQRLSQEEVAAGRLHDIEARVASDL